MDAIPHEILMCIASYLDQTDLDSFVQTYNLKVNWLQLIDFRFPERYHKLILEFDIEKIYKQLLIYYIGNEEAKYLFKYLILTDQYKPKIEYVLSVDDVDIYKHLYQDIQLIHFFKYFRSPNIIKYLLESNSNTKDIISVVFIGNSGRSYDLSLDVMKIILKCINYSPLSSNIVNTFILFNTILFNLNMDGDVYDYILNILPDQIDQVFIYNNFRFYLRDEYPFIHKIQPLWKKYSHLLSKNMITTLKSMDPKDLLINE